MLTRATAYLIGLGSNLGDRAAAIDNACRLLGALADGSVRRSPLYETPPMYVTDQPTFLNAVATFESRTAPEDMLQACLGIERELGRERLVPNGPRSIDLDVLAAEDWIIGDDALVLPHPRMHERPFVLVPLRDLDPSWLHPVLHQTVGAMLGACEDADAPVRVGDPREFA